jgi:H+-transporting ATPase
MDSFKCLNCSGWGWGLSVMAVSLIAFMFLDAVKVIIIKRWSFELTAKLWPVPSRKEKLRERQAQKIVNKRVRANIEKVRKVLKICRVLVAFPRKSANLIQSPPQILSTY